MLVHEFDALNKITTIVVFKAIVFFSVSLSSYFVCVCVHVYCTRVLVDSRRVNRRKVEE